ncbi:MAG: hemagglutinin repeat-containing protein [Holosporales bacterium]|jgi:hypothetical protein|nr:hemagglutinin repeat-containing protein [Holosporales bacterium]
MALLYGPTSREDAEIEINEDETALAPQLKPYLLIGDLVEDAMHKIKAEKTLTFRGTGDVIFRSRGPDDVKIDAQDLVVEADTIKLLSEFTYHDGAHVDTDPVVLQVPQSLTLLAKKEIQMRAANVNARTVDMSVEDGDIIDRVASLDPVSRREGGAKITRTGVRVSQIKAGDSLRMSAPKGRIEQTGTQLKAGPGGMQFESKAHVVKPAFETTAVEIARRRHTERVALTTPVEAQFQTSDEILFQSNATTLVGAQVIARSVKNLGDGNLRVTAAQGHKVSHSETTRRRRVLGISIGKSTQTVHVEEEFFEPAKIIAESFESTGDGTCIFEGVVANVLDMTIRRDLIEKAAYTGKTTRSVRHSSGFFAPKIRGDPFYESTRALSKTVTFGDFAPNVMNVIGTGAQALTHATKLANLSKLQNPASEFALIMLSRFVAGPCYSNVTTRTVTRERIPHQSKLDIGVLRVSNDRTHLEGIWHVNSASIETGQLTTEAPKYTGSQESETSGWSVSLNPAALLGAGLMPGAATAIGALPSVSVVERDGTTSTTRHLPMQFEADELFVRCNDAVFSGSTIRAKMIDMIVAGDMTVETLLNTFRAESSNTQVSGSIAAIFGAVKGVKLDRSLDASLAPIPAFRIAEEEVIKDKINTVASIVGTEKFYLKVGELLYNKCGMISDGVVAGRRVDEPVRERNEHNRTVINPSVGEFVACMAQVEEFNEIRQQYMTQRIAEGASMQQAEREVKQVPADTKEKLIAEIEEKPRADGATPPEIEQVLQNDQMNKLLDSSRAATA